MGKSRKYKGGKKDEVVSAPCGPGHQPCQQITAEGSSVLNMTQAGVKANKDAAQEQTKASKHLASGGGKKRRGGAAKVVCPQPAAGSGGSIPAGGSSAGANMCQGTNRSMQQNADAVGDSAANDLSTAPPCNPFSGSCPSSGGGRKRRRRRKTKKRRKKSKKRTRRKRRRRKRTRKKTRRKRRY